jgi:Aspartyl protease
MRALRIARLVGAVVMFAVVGSCVIGAPPGFSKGDSWTLPLVGPLEDGQLVTPVWINDKGPYLFAIDPDSPITVVDDGIVSEAKLYTGMGARYADEQDTTHPTHVAEVSKLRVGNLTVAHHNTWITHVGTFVFGGRQIRGVLGRDVIADSLVFGFDRDQGVAYLTTHKAFTTPAGAQVIGYELVSNKMQVQTRPVGRRLASVDVGGEHYRLHLDLGAVQSELKRGKWAAAGLAVVPHRAVLIDETGTRRQVTQGGVAGQVRAGDASASGIMFVPFDDRRWESTEMDGTLGLNFFRNDVVWADWDKSKLYLVPRSGVTDDAAAIKARIDRWGSQDLSSCPHTACVEVSVLVPPPPAPATPAPTPAGAEGSAMGAAGAGAGSAAAGAPVPPPPPPPPAAPAQVSVNLKRDPVASEPNLEITLEAVDAKGQPLGLPRLVANLPQGVDSVSQEVDPAYGPATLRVVDASPFVRACPGGGGCIFSLASAR